MHFAALLEKASEIIQQKEKEHKDQVLSLIKRNGQLLLELNREKKAVKKLTNANKKLRKSIKKAYNKYIASALGHKIETKSWKKASVQPSLSEKELREYLTDVFNKRRTDPSAPRIDIYEDDKIFSATLYSNTLNLMTGVGGFLQMWHPGYFIKVYYNGTLLRENQEIEFKKYCENLLNNGK